MLAMLISTYARAPGWSHHIDPLQSVKGAVRYALLLTGPSSADPLAEGLAQVVPPMGFQRAPAERGRILKWTTLLIAKAR